jgi:SAM-dependent methyltransferase
MGRVEPYGPETYGERVADVYDDWYVPAEDAAAVARTLAELAAGGRALELGIGTGRVALPLAAAGVEVHGIDASAAMVERMRAKPGGDAIPVVIGDFRTVPVDGPFALVFVVANTFFQLLSQDAQVECFAEVAARLAPGGRFVVEAFVPDLTRFDRDLHLGVRDVGTDAVRLDASVHDPQSQLISSTQVRITERGIRLVHARLRFAFPSELDLMARLAGLALEHRWGSFARAPFTAESATHVSVYRKR